MVVKPLVRVIVRFPENGGVRGERYARSRKMAPVLGVEEVYRLDAWVLRRVKLAVGRWRKGERGSMQALESHQ